MPATPCNGEPHFSDLSLFACMVVEYFYQGSVRFRNKFVYWGRSIWPRPVVVNLVKFVWSCNISFKVYTIRNMFISLLPPLITG